jgi:hypothetical protein
VGTGGDGNPKTGHSEQTEPVPGDPMTHQTSDPWEVPEQRRSRTSDLWSKGTCGAILRSRQLTLTEDAAYGAEVRRGSHEDVVREDISIHISCKPLRL